jgi:aldose 1-epimerase
MGDLVLTPADPGGSGIITIGRGTTRVVVDASRGARLTELHVDGHQLLAAVDDEDPALGGCYPMVPWAGRVRDGRFAHEGTTVQLELDAPPHALHGVAYRRAWAITAQDHTSATMSFDLAAPTVQAAGWPFGGRAVQTVSVREDGVEVAMRVRAGSRSMPVTIGWHPWFVRHLHGVEGGVQLDATSMYERGSDGLPTGALVGVPSGPWDDCMTGLSSPSAVEWPGIGRVEVTSDLDHLVVFDRSPRGICLEPQSGPPDEVNGPAPRVLDPGAELVGRMVLRWQDA